MDALVAKLIKSSDVPKIPVAAKAVQKEWDRLWKAKAWIKESVCEYESARSAANRDSREVHFGRVSRRVIKSTQSPQKLPTRGG